MISKNQIKLIRSLKLKKYRQKYNKFICEGVKIIDELLRFRPELLDQLYMTSSGHEKLKNSTEDEVHIIDERSLALVSQLSNNQDGLAVVNIPDEPRVKPGPFQFYLDGIRDPGNLGTIMRICDWFGIEGLWISPDCVDPYNPKVIQASMGSIFRVKVSVMAIDDLHSVHHPKLIGADTEGVNYEEMKADIQHNLFMVLGNEANGISQEARAFIGAYCSIPRIGQAAESLNVAVSAGILAAHFTRKVEH